MKPIKLTIKTKSEKYPILIGSNLLTQTSKILKKNLADFNNCLLVIDKKVPTKMTNKIIKSIKKKKIFQFSFNANEKNKNQKIVNDLIDILLKISQKEHFSGHCWGYDHPWQNTAFFAKRYFPNILYKNKNTIVTVSNDVILSIKAI